MTNEEEEELAGAVAAIKELLTDMLTAGVDPIIILSALGAVTTRAYGHMSGSSALEDEVQRALTDCIKAGHSSMNKATVWN